jgi:hypothetical protein
VVRGPEKAENLAQALAVRFGGDDWEWNEVADWVMDVFLPHENRLNRLKMLLDLQGAKYVTWEGPEPGRDLQALIEVMGMKIEVLLIGRRKNFVLVLQEGRDRDIV